MALVSTNEVMHRIERDLDLEDAANRMNGHQVGALPVFEGQRLVGIITERDLTAFVNRL